MSVSAGYREYLAGLRATALAPLEEAIRKGDEPPTVDQVITEVGLAWNLPIKHWSPSSLAMLRRCPYQWQQRYLLGRKARPAEAPVTGTAVHAGLARNFDAKMDTHVDIPTVELLEWYEDTGWATVLDIEQTSAGQEIQWDTTPEDAKRRGKGMLAGYRNEIAPRIQPTLVEGMVEVDFGLAVPVIGRIDIEQDASVIDVKTGKTAKKMPKEDWRIQAGIYGFARNRPVEFHSLTASPKTGKVSIWTPLEAPALLLAPTADERRRMVQDMRAISVEACMYMSVFGPDQPWPTHGVYHTWACDYCGFRAGCPAWSSDQ